MDKDCIGLVARALICRSLRDRVVDGGLIRLVYGIDQGPHVDDRSWTKLKIKVKTLLLDLKIGMDK